MIMGLLQLIPVLLLVLVAHVFGVVRACVQPHSEQQIPGAGMRLLNATPTLCVRVCVCARVSI